MRLASLVILGLAVIYAIGRWDSSIAREGAELEADTKVRLAQILTVRNLSDSLEALADSLSIVDGALQDVERELVETENANRELARQEVEHLAVAPLDSLLRPLRLQATRLRGGDGGVLYVTDSVGVRFLAGRMLRLAQSERELTVSRRVADTRAARIGVLTESLRFTTIRADSLSVQLALAAPLLQRWKAYNECRIFFVISCPSRTTSLIVGVVVGAVGTYALIRE